MKRQEVKKMVLKIITGITDDDIEVTENTILKKKTMKCPSCGKFCKYYIVLPFNAHGYSHEYVYIYDCMCGNWYEHALSSEYKACKIEIEKRQYL